MESSLSNHLLTRGTVSLPCCFIPASASPATGLTVRRREHGAWHTLGLVTVETGEASSLSLLPPPVLKPFPTPDSCPHPQILSGQTAGADGAHNYFEVRTRLRSLSFPRLYRTEMKTSPPELTETRFGRLRPHALSLWPSHSNETQANRSMTSTPPCCF